MAPLASDKSTTQTVSHASSPLILHFFFFLLHEDLHVANQNGSGNIVKSDWRADARRVKHVIESRRTVIIVTDRE